MSDFFEKLQSSINKNIKGVHASMMVDSDIATNRYWVPTPSYDLNRILSGSLYKGLQSRNLVAIIGPEHTFKSSFMILCMAKAINEGKSAVIIDTEGAINAEFCQRWGVDINKVFYVYTPFVSEVRSVLAQIRETGETDMIIGLDSVGGLDRLKQFEDAAKGEMKADQGLLQKEIRSTLKQFLNICIQQNSIGIATGHMYGSPGTGIPMPDQIGGGKAMRLFPSVLIQLQKKMMWKDDKKETKEIVGSEIEARTIKNRMYPPFQTASIKMNYIDGMEQFAGILELGETAGIIKKSGSWYSYGENRLGQGANNAMEGLKEFPEILGQIDKWLADTGYSTINKEIQEAEELLASEEEKRKIGKIENV